MRFSQMFAPTLREAPAEAEIASHRLMLRAGLLRKVSGGVYTYLPLGQRVLKKIMAIVREEMDRAGGLELMMPIIQPAEVWQKTGRWEKYGDTMFRLEDRHGRPFCLGPTHEELVTDLVASEVSSYRQLPLILYQIQNKYRDEIRPRYGVMRGREFIMKDAYSFDRDRAGLDASYQAMYDAYVRIFERCGLKTRAVLADPGAIGGDDNHEFMVITEAGEDAIVYCDTCSYAANIEKAEARPRATAGGEPSSDPGPLEAVATPGASTIEELVAFFNAPAERMIKSLVFLVDGEPVMALVRGDRELNEVKLARALGASTAAPADPETVERVTGAPVGFAGPIGLTGVRIVADREVPLIVDGITGANRADTHYVHVVYGRDYRADKIFDLRTAVEGDACPRCEGRLEAARGVEVGHVFKLGTTYSEALGAAFLDETGKERPVVMGCYGIGVSRLMAAIIEQHHDDDGIRWPISVAPFHVDLIVIDPNDERQRREADSLYQRLTAAGVEVILDDRDERPGVKFKDADLIGFPIRMVIGPRSLEEGKVEVRLRGESEAQSLPLDDGVQHALALLAPRS